MTAVRTSTRTLVALFAVLALALLAFVSAGVAGLGSDLAGATWHAKPQAGATWHAAKSTTLAGATWHAVASNATTSR